MIALFDVGNTHTHVGLANASRVLRRVNLATADWRRGRAQPAVAKFFRGHALAGAAFCSVSPAVTPLLRKFIRASLRLPILELGPANVGSLGIDYPKPRTIGPNRLANALAALRRFGAPAVVVDFGTAVTFDVVDPRGCYIGGIIAPGLNVMTDYLHEKTALLPRIKIRETSSIVGKSTVQAMTIGAVHGYRGLVARLIDELKSQLGCHRLPVIATGGYAELIAAKLPQITAVEPLLTLEGLRLAWEEQNNGASEAKGGESPCLECRPS